MTVIDTSASSPPATQGACVTVPGAPAPVVDPWGEPRAPGPMGTK